MTLLNHRQTTRKRKILSPGRVSMLSYAVLILLGAMLLLLPASTEKGHLDFIDALFTSASAVCVTGLIVVNTASTFTLFGKVVIIALIQTGGLGIMVLSTIFLVTLGKRVSMTGRQMLSETYSYGQGKNVYSLVKEIVIFTFIILEIGIANIVAKAISDPHKKVLEKIDVKNILFPEKDTARSMARKLDNPSLIDYLPLMEGYGIIELAVPEKFVGQNLKQIDLTNKYGVQIVAIKSMDAEHTLFSPKADDILNQEDILILLGPEKGLDTLKTATQK